MEPHSLHPAPMIEIQDLLAEYGSRIVLDHISFTIRSGEICAILGGSGCGKSTLLKHIMRLLTPTSGTIVVDGQDITFASGSDLQQAHRKMGVLFQSGALFGAMTLAENIALPLYEYTDLPGDVIRAIVRFKLGLVGLSGFEDYMPAEISGGMRKRAALARAMALDPKILLFDEMSAGLDPITSAELDQLVLGMNHSLGLTIVVVTHELPSIERIADHAVMLDKGKIIAEGTPAELKESSIPFVRAFFHRIPRNQENRSPDSTGQKHSNRTSRKGDL